MRRSHLKLWIPCFLFYAFITTLSSIPGSRWIGILEPPFLYFDKFVHFVLYAFMGMVLSRALAWEEYYHHIKKRWYIYFAIIFPMISLIDEVHQYFVPQRTMDYYDWMIDIAGGVYGALCYILIISGKNKSEKLSDLERRDVRGFGLILTMIYFMVLISLNLFNYKQGFLQQYSHLTFGFILVEYGLLGLLTIRFFYLRREKKFFLLKDWLWVLFCGACFTGLYQLTIFLLKNEFLVFQEVLWSMFSYFLGASGYYLEKQIERFRDKIHQDRFYKRRTWQRVYFFLPPALIMAIISFLSSQSPKILYEKQIPLPTEVLPKTGALSLFTNYFLLHGIQFFVLGVFYFRAINWEGWWHSKKQNIILWVCSVMFLISYAWFDEIHQSFTPGRVADMYDVLTNVTGILVSLFMYMTLYQRIKSRYFREIKWQCDSVSL